MSYHKSVAGVGWVAIVPSGTNPDPLHLAEIQSLELTENVETADLENADGDVIDAFVTKRTVEGSIALKDYSNSLLAYASRGATVATGYKAGFSTTQTIPSTPHQITITPPNSGTYATDLGVIDLTAGKMLKCDASAVAGVSYSLSGAVYTFASGDASHSVLINYQCTYTTGTTATVAAASASTVTKYALHCYNGNAGRNTGLYVPQALVFGLSAKFAKGGWVDSTLKFKATLDVSNNLYYAYNSVE